MSEYGVEYLKRLYETVEAFSEAFEAWLKTQDEISLSESRGIFPTVATKEGQHEGAVRELELDVAETAGLAARAVAVTGAYINILGIGPVDPISNWTMMSSPKAFIAPHDVRKAAANVKGRLQSMISDAVASNDSSVPSFSPANLHPLVWTAAATNWTIHQYRIAVREAAEALTLHWKEKLARNDVDDTVFWQQTLSSGEATPQKPKLVWPGDAVDKNVRGMRAGVEQVAKALNSLATGLNLTVRNITTHTRDELTEQEAMERLAAYSYLARLLDQCEIDRGSEAKGE